MSEPTPKESLQLVFEDLYEKGVALLKLYIVKCDELNIAFPIQEKDVPSFDKWYDKLYNDITNNSPMPKKERWNKVIQQGNFDISQPSGGFDVAVDKNTMISQYKKAVYGTPDAPIQQPLLMVITEPFVTTTFLNDTNYKLLNQNGNTCGVYYNTPFESDYEVVETPVDIQHPLVGQKLVFFQINKAGSDPIKIVNWHGNSNGDKNIDALIDIIRFADEKGIHYITGDSNITLKKGGVSIDDEDIKKRINEIQIDYKLSCSTNEISKKRIPMNIFYNNQIDKDRPDVKSDERDGMFILKLGTKKTVTGGTTVPIQTKKLVSFVTEYDKINSPILGDHSVVETDMNGLTLLVATGTNMDDEKIGLFGKKEWMNVDHATFKNRVSIPYTIRWVNEYNKWISKYEATLNPYSDKGCYFDNVSLALTHNKRDNIDIDSNDILEQSAEAPVQMQPALEAPVQMQPALEAPVQMQPIVRKQNPIKVRVPTQPPTRIFSGLRGGKSKKNKFKIKKTRKMKSTRRKRKQHGHGHRSKKR